jgi:glutathione S-transferase
MRARIALYYARVSYEHREILLKERPIELFQISPKGTVPVLHLKNGRVLDESMDIMKWCLSLNDPDHWFIDNIDKQIGIILRNDLEFKKWLDRYKYHIRYPENPTEFYRGKCEKILDDYENKLDNNLFFLGSSLSLADMAILPFVRQFAHVDINWFRKRYTSLSEWMDRLVGSPIFKKIMKKFEVWSSIKEGERVIFKN